MILAAAVAAALSMGTSAHAAEYRISGFGQFVAGQLKEDGQLMPTYQYSGDGIDWREDSLIAVQFDTTVTDRLGLTAQMVARGDREAELAWAYLKYDLPAGFSTKIGRQRTPFYRYSDFLDVGAAYAWMRPPLPVYNVPWSSMDGISLSHSAFSGKWYTNAYVFVGEYDGKVYLDPTSNDSSRATAKDAYAVALEVEYDEWLSVRASMVKSDVTIDLPAYAPIVDPLRQFGRADIASEILMDGDVGTYQSLGIKVERNDWRVEGEYSRLGMEDAFTDNTDRHNWYVSVARRFGQFTPYVVHGRQRGSINEELRNSLSPQNPLYPLVYAASTFGHIDQDYNSIGLRWDASTRFAFKADYTTFRDDVTAGEADLMSAGMVFTF